MLVSTPTLVRRRRELTLHQTLHPGPFHRSLDQPRFHHRQRSCAPQSSRCKSPWYRQRRAWPGWVEHRDRRGRTSGWTFFGSNCSSSRYSSHRGTGSHSCSLERVYDLERRDLKPVVCSRARAVSMENTEWWSGHTQLNMFSHRVRNMR